MGLRYIDYHSGLRINRHQPNNIDRLQSGPIDHQQRWASIELTDRAGPVTITCTVQADQIHLPLNNQASDPRVTLAGVVTTATVLMSSRGMGWLDNTSLASITMRSMATNVIMPVPERPQRGRNSVEYQY
jgi:hypothetical protein